MVFFEQSGDGARHAAAALDGVGLANVNVLDAGLDAWIASGLPVNRRGPRLSRERPIRVAVGALAAIGSVLAVAINPRFAQSPTLVGSDLAAAVVSTSVAWRCASARLLCNRAVSCDLHETFRGLNSGR